MYKLFNKTSTQPHHTLSRDQHAYQQNVIATTRVHSIMVSHWCRSSCRIMPLLMLLLIFLYHTMCPTQVQMEQCKQKSVTNTSSTTCFIATVFFLTTYKRRKQTNSPLLQERTHKKFFENSFASWRRRPGWFGSRSSSVPRSDTLMSSWGQHKFQCTWRTTCKTPKFLEHVCLK